MNIGITSRPKPDKGKLIVKKNDFVVTVAVSVVVAVVVFERVVENDLRLVVVEIYSKRDFC